MQIANVPLKWHHRKKVVADSRSALSGAIQLIEIISNSSDTNTTVQLVLLVTVARAHDSTVGLFGFHCLTSFIVNEQLSDRVLS